MSIKRKSSLNPGRVQSMKFPGLRESSRKEPGCCIVKKVVKFFEGIHNQLKKCDHRYYVKIYIVTCVSLCLSIYLYMFHYMNIHWKDWCWSWSSHTLAIWCEELTHRKRLWCWERLRAEGEAGNRGRDGWVASPIQRTWVWVNSRR